MTVLQSVKPLSAELAQLAHLSLDHLEREEAFLNANLNGLELLRSALLDHDHGALKDALREQEDLARVRERLFQERALFRQQAALLLDAAPARVCLSLVVERLRGKPAERLARRREQLAEKARELERLGQSTAALTNHCLDFLNRFFLEITGGQCDGRYSPKGGRAPGACGSFIEMRG